MSKQYEKGSNRVEVRNETFTFRNEVVIRAPFYSYEQYDPAKLPDILKREEFRSAIQLASEALYTELAKKQFNPDLLTHKEINTLLKYYNRMSFRPVPFGGFASFGITRWGTEDNIRLANPQDAILHLRQDQRSIMQSLVEKFPVEKSLFIVNPTLYQVGGQLRYFRSTESVNGMLSFNLEAVSAEKFNKKLIRRLRDKPADYAVLLQYIMNNADCTREEAHDYLGFLLKAQVIYSQIQGDVIAAEEDEYDRTVSQKHFPAYAALERGTVKDGPPLNDKEELSQVVGTLMRLSKGYQSAAMEKFIDDFKEKFDREKVPLLIALDPDTGVGYGDLQSASDDIGWLKNIAFPVQEPASAPVPAYALPMRLLDRWMAGDRRMKFDPLEITEADLDTIGEANEEWLTPPSFSVMFSRVRDGILLESVGGLTATSLIGRFSLFSEDTATICRQIAEDEANWNPGIVFADIAQRSADQIDNVNRRKPIYKKVIPVNVYSSQALEDQISPSDLMVSIVGRELIIESRSLHKRVIPRLATAYNYQHTQLTIFRFLCDLQHQGLKTRMAIDLETYFSNFSFYPRLVYKRTVLCLAKWKLTAKEVGTLTALPFSLGRLHQFRSERGVPNWISMGKGDQRLVFNLLDDAQAKFFLHNLTGLADITLYEYLLPDKSCRSEGKPMAAQYVAFCQHTRPVYSGGAEVDAAKGRQPQRDFLPGSEWLYIKFYCTSKSADVLLSEMILPLIRKHKALIESWFFIRFVDPGHHIRLRLKIKPENGGALLAAFEKRLTLNRHGKLVDKFTVNTYQREMERYNPEIIVSIEELFNLDSELVLAIIGSNEDYLSVFPIVDHIINVFFSEPAEKEFYLQDMTDRLLIRFKAEKQLVVDLDKKYRLLRDGISVSLAVKPDIRTMASYFNKAKGIAALTLKWTGKKRRILAADIIHMHVNRLFPANQVHHEAIIYYCLNKHCRSKLLMNKKG